MSGDFTAEVKVTHVDQAMPNSVLKSLGGFSTAYHAATLLVWTNQKNLIRKILILMNLLPHPSRKNKAFVPPRKVRRWLWWMPPFMLLMKY